MTKFKGVNDTNNDKRNLTPEYFATQHFALGRHVELEIWASDLDQPKLAAPDFLDSVCRPPIHMNTALRQMESKPFFTILMLSMSLGDLL